MGYSRLATARSSRRRRKPEPGPRFGLRAPKNGAPVRFRVLVSMRWLVASVFITLAALVSSFLLPRRRRVPTLFSITGVLGIGAMASAVAEARRLRFEHITLDVPDLPVGLDGLKIAQLSDFHLGQPFTEANLRRALDWLKQVQPDVIALTGDFVGDERDIGLLKTHIRGISAPQGVYAVLGNHDYWTDIPAIEQVLQENGIVLLRNEQRSVIVNGAMLSIVGIDCVWEKRHDLELAFRDRPQGVVTLVLAHEPDIADEVARHRPTLQLSGHTHAGHFALPILGPAFLPRHGFRYFRGLQRVGEMTLYVSRGLGGFPLRLGTPPEATLFTLRRQA